MGRHRQAGARRLPRAVRLVHGLRSLPWVTLVLVGLVLTCAVALLRPDDFSATGTVAASTPTAAGEVAVALASPDLPGRVEDEVELAQDRRGSLTLDVELLGPSVVAVRALAPDPRLAALAADTAVALVVDGRADLRPEQAAVVPSRPVPSGRTGHWIAGAATALVVALLVEQDQLHREERAALAARGRR